jgi:hypothetical protein
MVIMRLLALMGTVGIPTFDMEAVVVEDAAPEEETSCKGPKFASP